MISLKSKLMMKLADAYTEPEQYMVAPEDFDINKMHLYEVVDGQLVMPPENIKKEIIDKTQERLDKFAQSRGYDNMFSLCTYAVSTNPKFQAEGQRGIELRDAMWAKLAQILEEVESGQSPIPKGYEDIEPELPELTWPDEV